MWGLNLSEYISVWLEDFYLYATIWGQDEFVSENLEKYYLRVTLYVSKIPILR